MLTLRNIAGIVKPEYLFRPHQIGRRLWREIVNGRRKEVKSVRLPWGLDITVDLSEAIGWSLYTRALYETAVTETLWRLARPGESVVDGGSNVGYMASVLAVRVGNQGRVYCFEPHPEVFQELQRNVRSWETSKRCGTFLLYEAALGDCTGVAMLSVPECFSQNRGTSTIEPCNSNEVGRSIAVNVLTLDEAIPENETVGVIKLDVQGYELSVLKGMERLLRNQRVRNVVFEEEKKYPAETHKFLQGMGYRIFGIEQHFRGIRCIADGQPCCDLMSTPNYLATIDSDLTVSRLQRGFWESFGPAQLFK